MSKLFLNSEIKIMLRIIHAFKQILLKIYYIQSSFKRRLLFLI